MTATELAHPIFAGVEQAVQHTLTTAGTVQRFAAGDELLTEDDDDTAFFVLLSGSVKVLYRNPDGYQVVVKLLAAPAVFGEMECLAGIPYLESVAALETAQALVIPRDAFLAALDTSHRLTRNLLGDVSARLCIAAQNERALAFNPVETRLASLLLTYLDMYGLPVEQGSKIRIPLTQDDLANALGVARRSITRVVTRWLKDRVLIKERGHFIIADCQALQRVTDPELLGIGYSLGEALHR